MAEGKAEKRQSGGAYCPAASALQVVGVLHGRAAVGGDARITAVRVIGRPVRLPPLSALYLQDFVPLEEPQFFALCALFAEPALLCVLSGCAERALPFCLLFFMFFLLSITRRKAPVIA